MNRLPLLSSLLARLAAEGRALWTGHRALRTISFAKHPATTGPDSRLRRERLLRRIRHAALRAPQPVAAGFRHP